MPTNMAAASTIDYEANKDILDEENEEKRWLPGVKKTAVVARRNGRKPVLSSITSSSTVTETTSKCCVKISTKFLIDEYSFKAEYDLFSGEENYKSKDNILTSAADFKKDTMDMVGANKSSTVSAVPQNISNSSKNNIAISTTTAAAE